MKNYSLDNHLIELIKSFYKDTGSAILVANTC